MAKPTKGIGERQLVVFRLAQDTYGFDIDDVREIIRMQEITRVPNAPTNIEGVINLRGRICPVLDLRARLGVRVSAATAESRIVVVEIDGDDVGMIVDAVTEVLRVPADSIQPTASLAVAADSRVVEGIANFDDRLIIVVALGTLLSGEDQGLLAEVRELAAA
jgi:purine-binding chemotaxis protein CheW